ncbi:von Willebrand factor A domain-containing protein 8, partial [Blyttiomyces sp. JEL0837]
MATRRLKQIADHALALSDDDELAVDRVSLSSTSADGSSLLTIGGVTIKISQPQHPELVPDLAETFFEDAQEVLRHLRWMMQKDSLGQDMFLIGPPGTFKRYLVWKYAQLAKREVEYVALSKDMTDSDLKQRREIKDGSAYYTDQACVRAAIHGRILVLDGIEKAERNVLPILNNLLENREMSLDDGRFLVHPSRYDKLVASHEKTEMDKWKINSFSLYYRLQLVKTSSKFLVIALGLPIPKYEGFPLDPPLRSRFQARNISTPTFLSQLQQLRKLAPNVPQRTAERLISVGMVLRSDTETTGSITIPEFPTTLDSAIKILDLIPTANQRAILDMMYPFTLLPVLEDEQRSVIEATYSRFDFQGPPIRIGTTSSTFGQAALGFKVPSASEIQRVSPGVLKFKLILPEGGGNVVSTRAGPTKPADAEFFVSTEYHSNLLSALVTAHLVSDFCIIGEKGAGKSALLRAFVQLFGYRSELIPLYKDMSARDLLQRRSTTSSGDTIWEISPLVKAALEGSLAILDQIEVLSFGTLASIQRLITEREATLPDGTQLVPAARFARLFGTNKNGVQMLNGHKVLPIHPSFRIVAIARPTSSTSPRGTWLSPEIANLFLFVAVRPLSYLEEMEVIQTLCSGIDEAKLKQLLQFANMLRTQQDETARSLASAVSTRQLIRIARRLALYPSDSLYEAVFKSGLGRFLPSMAREYLEKLLHESGIRPSEATKSDLKYEIIKDKSGVEHLQIGDVSYPVSTSSNPLLVPDIVYHDNAKQTEILREMLKDYSLDTTVHSLTSTPSIVDGALVYEDSPLVRAVKEGYILVVDEADKAPTHVTSILKSLVEDGEMVLSDGRRIVSRLVEGSD